VFSHQDWSRLGESHAPYIRVHWPDGHYTDGIDKHTEDMAALFVWAPNLRIQAHPLRVAKDNLTAVTGVMKGTFTQPMPDGKGGTIAPVLAGSRWPVMMCGACWPSRCRAEPACGPHPGRGAATDPGAGGRIRALRGQPQATHTPIAGAGHWRVGAEIAPGNSLFGSLRNTALI
jgi:hypothetical protein